MTKGIKGFQKGHRHSEATKKKIGLANRGIWVNYNCDFCGKANEEKESHYKKSRFHFCDMECYKSFVKNQPFFKQNAYRGVRKKGHSKQVYYKNYCKNHPENTSHLKARRYAREKGAIGSHALKEWQDLKKSCGYKCVGCGNVGPLTKDHITPLSEGGTDYIENIQPMCRSCNSKKWKHIYKNPELLSK